MNLLFAEKSEPAGNLSLITPTPTPTDVGVPPSCVPNFVGMTARSLQSNNASISPIGAGISWRCVKFATVASQRSNPLRFGGRERQPVRQTKKAAHPRAPRRSQSAGGRPAARKTTGVAATQGDRRDLPTGTPGIEQRNPDAPSVPAHAEGDKFMRGAPYGIRHLAGD
jgi:hypothetical protein